jgi:hypothetical protein
MPLARASEQVMLRHMWHQGRHRHGSLSPPATPAEEKTRMTKKLPAALKKAPLPINYTKARKALAACTKVDECAKWAKKATVLASYHKQMNDKAMVYMAQKIRNRAIERGGDILNQLQREKSGPSRIDATGRIHPRNWTNLKQAIAEAGLTPAEARTMIAVARVPKDQFEAMTERDKPATVKQLVAVGTRKRLEWRWVKPEPYRNEYIEWTVAVRHLSALPACGLEVLAVRDPDAVADLRVECAAALANLSLWKSALAKAKSKEAPDGDKAKRRQGV